MLKLEDDPANPELILTARGTGYLFQRIIDSVASEGSESSPADWSRGKTAGHGPFAAW